MKVSVIIVTYNTLRLTQKCIESIFAHTVGVDFEVIVVDNDSSDGSCDVLGSDQRIRYIRCDSNLGFGKANNIGMAQATGEYILLLNSDTVLRDNAILAMYDSSVRYGRKLGALGTILESEDRHPVHSFGSFPTIWSSMLDPYLRPFKKHTLDTVTSLEPYRQVDYVTGADMMVPRSVVDAMGGFDPDYFMYSEECDWQKRMADNGLDRVVIPSVGIIHLEGKSESSARCRWSYNRYFNALRSRIIYHRKHSSIAEYAIFRMLFPLFRLPIIVSAPFSWTEKRNLFNLLVK